jgi:hypothetical protein
VLGSLDSWSKQRLVYNGTISADLNFLIDDPDWIGNLDEAVAINNSGQIVAHGSVNSAYAAFLLTPNIRHRRAINALLWEMLLGWVSVDGNGPIFIGSHIPGRVGPGDPSSLSPAARDAVISLAVDAVARELGDHVPRRDPQGRAGHDSSRVQRLKASAGASGPPLSRRTGAETRRTAMRLMHGPRR